MNIADKKFTDKQKAHVWKLLKERQPDIARVIADFTTNMEGKFTRIEVWKDEKNNS